MIISEDVEKVFVKILIKKSLQTRNRRELPQHDKEHLRT